MGSIAVVRGVMSHDFMGVNVVRIDILSGFGTILFMFFGGDKVS